MTTLIDLLTQIGGNLHVSGVPATAQAGQHIVAGVSPALQTISVTEIVDHPVSLDLLAKDVVFSNTAFGTPGWIDDPAIAKTLPLYNMALAIPALDNSGVPGLVGKLKGTFPVAVPGEALPKLAITWTVTDDGGNVLAEGSDILAPAGLSNPTLDLVFLPIFARFDGASLPAVKRFIAASGTLSVGTTSVPVMIPPIPVLLPVIPFPKVLALTVDSNFRGAALILVSGNSGVTTIDHLRAVLQPVRSAINTLTGIAKFAAMLTGIDTLTSILNAAHIELRKGDKFDNLNDITLIQNAWYENDIEAEDELSSFVYLAPPSQREGGSDNKVAMCNDRNQKDGQGKFTVNTGESFVALCATLHSNTPTVVPGDAALVVNHPPAGFWTGNFGDELSSIQFL